MRTPAAVAALAIALACTTFSAAAQSTVTKEGTTITISEPAKITIQQLYDAADTVAVVQIVAADGENYTTNVYKAKVVTSFKGSGEDTIYFGPFAGYGLNKQYLLFLRKSPTTKDPVSTAAPAFGSVPFAQIFEEGYSALQMEYRCAFPGADPAVQCDDAVRVCTDYITLPKNIHGYSTEKGEPPFGCRWVHKKEFLALVATLGSAKK